MSGQIFNIQDDGRLVEMNEEPFANEDLFQELLEKYPNLLAGDQFDSASPRRWLLIKREMGVPNEEGGGDRWSLDHLFLDQDGIPSLVEVKRSSDTRIRREVVGQMLDYAANAVVYWPVERIRAEFEASTQDALDRLSDFLGEDGDPENFWQQVKTNLQANRIRMLFVADVIPPELKRIVEFLNEITDPTEVLAVEIKHYAGQGLKTLVPRVIGSTAKRGTGPGPARAWGRDSFLAVTEETSGKDNARIATNILDWAQQNAFSLRWGQGRVHASFFVTVKQNGQPYDCIAVFSGGHLSFRLHMLKRCPAFSTEQGLGELRDQIRSIPGGTATEDDVADVAMSVFQNSAALDRLFEVLIWVRDRTCNT